jgi:Dolichyl-phosphate-mannose-protein mannosyltransferase
MTKILDYKDWKTPASQPSSPQKEEDRRLARIATIKSPATRRELFLPEEVMSVTNALRAMCTIPLPVPKVKDKSSHTPDYWLWLVGIVASIVSVCATIYSFLHHDILLYADAYSHMRIARSVIDSLTPGFGQLGGVWLPLPHLLMIPFIWSDYLWETGLAGSIPSMICYITAAIFIFLTARRITRNNFASLIGSLVFICNPNVFYLQTTPLSEPVCFATFTIAGYYFMVWAQEDRIRYLVIAAATAFLATLSRYDGWALFLSMFFLVALIGVVRRQSWKQTKANLIVFGMLGGFGIVLWLVWEKFIFGNPLYFQQGVFSSQIQTQLFFGNNLLYRHNIVQAVRYYGTDCMDVLGPVVAVFAILSLVKFIATRRHFPEILAALSFLSPLLFYTYSFYSGQVALFVPELGNQIFNTRFGTEAVIPASIFIATLFNINFKLSKLLINVMLYSLLGMVIIAQFIMLWNNGLITVEDGQYGLSCKQTLTTGVYLATHYNGGLILEDTYLNVPDDSEAGIHLENVINNGSGDLWGKAIQNPGRLVDWVLVGERLKNSPDQAHINVNSPRFKSQFTLVIHDQSQGFYLYHKNGLPPLPNKTLSTNFVDEHQYCYTKKLPKKGEW